MMTRGRHGGKGRTTLTAASLAASRLSGRARTAQSAVPRDPTDWCAFPASWPLAGSGWEASRSHVALTARCPLDCLAGKRTASKMDQKVRHGAPAGHLFLRQCPLGQRPDPLASAGWPASMSRPSWLKAPARTSSTIHRPAFPTASAIDPTHGQAGSGDRPAIAAKPSRDRRSWIMLAP
jgi:hypothetical protein